MRPLPAPPSNPGVAGAVVPASAASGPDDRDALIAKDQEVITALTKVVEDQGTEISQLTISRDQWKASSEAEHRAVVGLQIALDAQKVVSKSDKWIGRVEGFAIGIGAGYVAGRLH